MRNSSLDSMDYINGSTAASSSRFAAGLILGAVAGAAIALLFAPTTGQKLRRQLRQRADEAAGRARHMYDEAASTVGEYASRVKGTSGAPSTSTGANANAGTTVHS